MSRAVVSDKQHQEAPQARRGAAMRRALLPTSGVVHLKEIATVILTVSWEASQIGDEQRRRRLAILHRIAANACEGLQESPMATADPGVEMSSSRGHVRIEMQRESDYAAAAAVLATAYQLAVGHKAVIA